jgi:hypothetical protein
MGFAKGSTHPTFFASYDQNFGKDGLVAKIAVADARFLIRSRVIPLAFGNAS